MIKLIIKLLSIYFYFYFLVRFPKVLALKGHLNGLEGISYVEREDTKNPHIKEEV